MTDETPDLHLEVGEVCAYLDRTLSAADRTRVEAHLADCGACQREVIAVSRVIHAVPTRRRLYVPTGLAAAAVLVLVLLPRPDRSRHADAEPHREPAVTTSAAPVAFAPHGLVTPPIELIWTGVPRADRYRVRVFDSNGSVAWEALTADTALALPDSVGLRRGAAYFWKVEARTAIDRWVASDLIDFSIVGRSRP